MSIETALTTSSIATMIALFSYTYLYIQYRQAYLAQWMAAWLVLFIREVSLDQQFVAQLLSPLFMIIYAMLTIGTSMLLVIGTMSFVGKRLPWTWLCGFLVCAGFSIGGIMLKLTFYYFGLPVIVCMALSYIATGIIFWRFNVSGWGNLFTGTAFVLLGIHLLDMIFLFPFSRFVSLGFLLDALLKFVVAIGIVVVYFERVRSELAEQGRYYRLLTENATDVIYRYRLIEPKGFEYVSQAVKAITGYEPEYFRNIRQVMRIIYPADRGNFRELVRTTSTKDDFTTLRVKHKNGDIVWTEQKYSIVKEPGGRVVAMEGIIRDVTSRVLLEQDMSRLDRLNVAGQMAANLAHEVRNPLTTLRGYLQLLGNKQEFESYKNKFIMMLEEVDRTNTIISEYLSLSKNKVVDMHSCSLNDIVMSLYPLLQVDAVASNVEVDLDLGQTPELWLDDKEIKQLILNLTRNAIEAMPSGGRMRISTTANGQDIVLAVKDEGSGIPQQVMENLGKPFLTTKENGTGLGMAICYRIAGRHRAKMDIETGPPGTTINVKFPIC
ncbi:MAG: sasA 2 [Firmicutes bacterium]|nr:sasA 2 [Bacillota bacterium]